MKKIWTIFDFFKCVKIKKKQNKVCVLLNFDKSKKVLIQYTKF